MCRAGRRAWAMEAMLLLAQAETDMKLSPRPKTQLEAALVKLLRA